MKLLDQEILKIKNRMGIISEEEMDTTKPSIGDIYKTEDKRIQLYKIKSFDETTKEYDVTFSSYDGINIFDSFDIKLTEKWFEDRLQENKLTKITEEEYNNYLLKNEVVGCSYDKTKGIDLGDVTEIPMNGIAKFTGEIDGKEVTINGCFSNGKVILTYDEGETGSRGNFKGNYYTTDTSQPFSFSGDTQFSNKFLFGSLINTNEIDIEEYQNNFHTKSWKYIGYFTKDGKLGESNSEIKITDTQLPSENKKPTILFVNNDYYFGEFKDSKIEGKGSFVFGNSGLRLDGIFSTVDNGEGGVTYSVKLDSGKIVDDIFDYDQRLLQNKGEDGYQPMGKILKDELDFCKSEFSLYIKMLQGLNNGEDVQIPNNLQKTKDFLKSCYTRYKDESNYFNYKKNKGLVLLMNPGSELYNYKIVLENKDIYNKTNNMGISISIRKVLNEQTEKNQESIIEKKIIKNRLGFIFESSNKKELNKNLYKESKNLIQRGYDEKTVKSFLRRLLN